MNRRKFILKSALSGIGISLLPSIAISNNDFSTFDIGEVNYHHRHGNLFNSKEFSVNHPKIKKIGREVFYKNGHCSSPEDAYKITLNSAESFFISPINRNKVHQFENHKLVFVDNANITVFNDDILIPLTDGNKAIEFNSKRNIKIEKPHLLIKKD